MTVVRRLLDVPKRHSKEWRIGLCVALILVAVGLNPVFAHVRQNWQVGYDRSEVPCMPFRFYLIALRPVDPARGDIVAFRIKGIPLFADGEVFAKQVIAVPGDVVSVDAAGATVNGRRLLFTDRALRKLSTSGQALARSYRLGKDEYFMAGTSPTSYDSRYYGPVQAAHFIGDARPLW